MPKKDGSPTVAEKRAARKASGTVRPGSVADNRAKAQEKAQTMLQYKVENNINKAQTRKKEQRQLPARQQREGSVAYNRANNTNQINGTSQINNTNQTNNGNLEVPKYGGKFITTAAGYRIEQGAHSASVKEIADKRREESKAKYGAGHNDFTYSNGEYIDFDDDGYFNADTTKAMWQNTKLLRDAGYKVGDTLWRPGSKDLLNDRTFTGKIRSDANGVFTPEYEEERDSFNKQLRLKEGSQFLNRLTPNEYSDVKGQHHANYFKNNIQGLEGLNNTEKLSTEGLYKDKYYGPSHGDAWTEYVGSQHYEAEAGVNDVGGGLGGGRGFYDQAKIYMDDGGYAGDVLKQIDKTGEKDRLTSPDQIAWYNSLIQRANDFDWSATYSTDPSKGMRKADPRGKGTHSGVTTTGHTSMSTYTPATYDNNGNVLTPATNTHNPSNDNKYTPQPKTSSSTAGSSTPGLTSTPTPEPENNSLYDSNLGYQDWEQQMATAQSNMNNINPYSIKPGKTKASNMNLTFDPYKY